LPGAYDDLVRVRPVESGVLTRSRHGRPRNHLLHTGMTNDKIRALVSRWRQRVEAQEQALEEVDRMEEAGVDLPEPETSRLLTQAHQNELERCIMELEQLFD
jgi:DNA-directed RNA polymerase specialized sigma24 family protein